MVVGPCVLALRGEGVSVVRWGHLCLCPPPRNTDKCATGSWLEHSDYSRHSTADVNPSVHVFRRGGSNNKCQIIIVVQFSSAGRESLPRLWKVKTSFFPPNHTKFWRASQWSVNSLNHLFAARLNLCCSSLAVFGQSEWNNVPIWG